MKKFFSIECPNCNEQIQLMVEVTRNADGSVGIDDFHLNVNWLQRVGNGDAVMHACDEIPSSAAFSIPVVSNSAGDYLSDVNVNVSVVDTDVDAIADAIEEGGYVPNGHLFRRWIMAQDSHAESTTGGITAWIHAKGYEYQWTSAIHELEVTLKIRERDSQNYVERIRWMHDKVFIAMAKDYVRQLKDYLRGLSKFNCNGRKYVRLPKQSRSLTYLHDCHNLFVDRIEADVIVPLEGLVSKMERSSGSYRSFVDTVKKFNDSRIIVKRFTQCREWIDAYKAIGAYYTLKNAVLFHGLHLVDASGNSLEGNAALAYLNDKADEYCRPDSDGHEQGYKLYGLKREAMEYNAFDFEARMRELGVR